MQTLHFHKITKATILFALLTLLLTCQKPDRDNPWDPGANLDPNAWAPKNLTIEDVSITSKKLNWHYDGDQRVEGFAIDRKQGNGNWELQIATMPKETTEWTDTLVIPDTALTYYYRVATYAGPNKSGAVEKNIKVRFPKPTNLQAVQQSEKSFTLNWTDNSTGEKGFKIDRKVGISEWQTPFDSVGENITQYTDTNLFATKTNIEVRYKVYAYHSNINTAKTETTLQTTLSAPTDFRYFSETPSSLTLVWNDNSNGEQGYKIDRKLGNNDWVTAFVMEGQNQTTLTDNSNPFVASPLEYRLYAFAGIYVSDTTTLRFTSPEINTGSVSSVTANSATVTGSVLHTGGLTAARGVCYGTTQNPTTANNIVTAGNGAGNFTANLAALTNGTTYYVRAFATNKLGTCYGEQRSFNTHSLPTITTSEVINITTNYATCGGNITNEGNSPVTARGVVWSTQQNPALTTCQGQTINGTGVGRFSSDVNGLTNGTLYYIRAYATNTSGTAYGEERVFTTLAGFPTVTTKEIVNISSSSAIAGGLVTNDGGGTIQNLGICISNQPNPTTNDGCFNPDGLLIDFTVNITGLSSNTTYYVRAYATNEAGTYYGQQKTFKTLYALPALTTSNVTNITNNSVTCGGIVNSDGGTAVTARGVVYSNSTSPTISNNIGITNNGSGTGYFASSVAGLTAGTMYYIRAYATNSAGTGYGEIRSFITTSNASPPVITTNNVENITSTTAICGGNVTSDGGATVTQRGVCFATTQNPTTANSSVASGNGAGAFSVNLEGLTPSTTYYVRAYATNNIGTSYGEQLNFTTANLQLGDYYEGGNIFYIDETGLHGLVCESEVQCLAINWDSANSVFNNVSINGYSDWRLPTIEELNLLYLNKEYIEHAGIIYWSSTACSSGEAWSKAFDNGYLACYDKTWICCARAVRTF